MPVGESNVDAIVGMIRQGRIQDARKTLKETVRSQPKWAAKWYLFARLLTEGTEREERIRQTAGRASSTPLEETTPSQTAPSESAPDLDDRQPSTHNPEVRIDTLSAERLARLEAFLSSVRLMQESRDMEREVPVIANDSGLTGPGES